ncbi:MAG: polysaccharide pyruvyl transferase family protein [Clostridia bacterium]|nr:polysaccharide pyruvyl transferase family protein [Clostridia bacterium]
MLHYALAWRPGADNLGADLLTLAAMRLLPRIDMLLDADNLDAYLPQIEDKDRVIALIPGLFLRSSAHWPPERHIVPVLAGVHIAEEDVWGLPLSTLDGAGLQCLSACAPVACRDVRTAARLEKLGVAHTLTGCLTLALQMEEQPSRQGIVCCDVPDAAVRAIKSLRSDVTEVTHHLDEPSEDFETRMADAQAMLRRYAGAEMVFTRRLHCAMACLAVGTPVLLLYNDDYEDVSRFAPMDTMLRKQPLDQFVQELEHHGLPRPWKNPADMAQVRKTLLDAVFAGLARAENTALPIVPPQEAVRWRETRFKRMTDSAEAKIQRLENQHYEELHTKFSLLLREDSAKQALTEILTQPEVARALRRADVRLHMKGKPLREQLSIWFHALLGDTPGSGCIEQLRQAIAPLGWPEDLEEHEP